VTTATIPNGKTEIANKNATDTPSTVIIFAVIMNTLSKVNGKEKYTVPNKIIRTSLKCAI
jgi:hypothetical protein